jgi:hypothetical protein
MMTHVIPWVTPEQGYKRAFSLNLEDADIAVDWMEHAIPAMEALRKTKYPVILTDLVLSPGLEVSDPEYKAFADVMQNEWLTGVYFGPRITELMIRGIRGNGSANATTPIILTQYDQSNPPIAEGIRNCLNLSNVSLLAEQSERRGFDLVEMVQRYL